MANNILVTSCDAQYALNYGPALLQSCLDANQPIHFNVANPMPDVKKVLDKMAEKGFEGFEFSYLIGVPKDPFPQVYSLYRFVVAQQLLHDPKRENEAYYLSDVDAIINRSLPEPDFDLGLWLRLDENLGANDWEREAMKVAAGIVYLNHNAIAFLDKFNSEVRQAPLQWFVDQWALYKAYQSLKNGGIVFQDLKPLKLMGWDMDNPDVSPILTAKGPRKNHPTFQQRKKELEEEFWK